MQDISRLCMACLSIKDENNICPRCRKDVEIKQDPPLLPLKSILAERYCIARKIKQNGEGVTYCAYDLKLDKPVTVREFLPEAIAARSHDEQTVIPSAGSENDFAYCRANFIELWSRIMRLKGLTSLITVTDVFELNSTAYAVYDESELLTLSDYLKSTQEGFMPWDKARVLFMPVLSTLGTLHSSGVLHRGINPSSFVFSKDGKLKLTDFATESARTLYSDLQPELFDGYAPFEQYSSKGMIGTWSDIYSFCAVLYRSLIGIEPIDARTRAQDDHMMIPAKFAELLPQSVITALINGMQIAPNDRLQTVEQLRVNLSAGPRGSGSSAPIFTKPSPPSKYISSKPAPEAQPEAAKPQPDPAPVTVPDREDSPIPAQRPAREEKLTPPPKQAKKTYAAVQASSVEERRRKSEQQRREREAVRREEAEKKKKKVVMTCLIAILAALLIGIVFITKAIVDLKNEPVTEPPTTTVEELRMENFVGLKIDDIMTNPVYTGKYVITQETENSASVNVGIVMRQSVEPSTPVTSGTPVVLTVSAGPKDITLIDVKELVFEDAKAQLKALGFKVTKNVIQNDGAHTENTVKETIPEAGMITKEGAEIKVIVWMAPDPAAVIDLAGQGDEEEAEENAGDEEEEAPAEEEDYGGEDED